MGIWDLNTFGFENGFCTPTLKLRRSPSQAKSSVETKLRAVLLATSLKWAVGWLLILKLQGSYSPPPRPLPSPPPPLHSPSDQVTWGCIRGLFSFCLSPHHGGEAGVFMSPRAMWAGVLPLVGPTMLHCWSVRGQTENRPFRSGVGQPSL